MKKTITVVAFILAATQPAFASTWQSFVYTGALGNVSHNNNVGGSATWLGYGSSPANLGDGDWSTGLYLPVSTDAAGTTMAGSFAVRFLDDGRIPAGAIVRSIHGWFTVYSAAIAYTIQPFTHDNSGYFNESPVAMQPSSSLDLASCTPAYLPTAFLYNADWKTLCADFRVDGRGRAFDGATRAAFYAADFGIWARHRPNAFLCNGACNTDPIYLAEFGVIVTVEIP